MQVLTRLKHSLYNHTNYSDSTPATDDCQLTPEEAIDILSAARRRYIITYLNQIGEEISVRELSQVLCQIDESDRKSFYITCHQNHLPKLYDMNVIEYDRRAAVVAPGRNCQVLARISQKIEHELN